MRLILNVASWLMTMFTATDRCVAALCATKTPSGQKTRPTPLLLCCTPQDVKEATHNRLNITPPKSRHTLYVVGSAFATFHGPGWPPLFVHKVLP